jgi:uncharacterized protein
MAKDISEGVQTPEQKGRGGKSERGFASMDPAKQREIASKGGKAAHQAGTAHEFSSEEAREAGRKGGQVVSQNRAHMAAIGRKGGEARGSKRSKKVVPNTPGGQGVTHGGVRS